MSERREKAPNNHFDKGAIWACEYIHGLIEADKEVKVKHGWPLSYEALKDTIETFIAGQLNRGVK